jgi:hypothetical protein
MQRRDRKVQYPRCWPLDARIDHSAGRARTFRGGRGYLPTGLFPTTANRQMRVHHQGQRARPDGASMDVSTDVDVVMEMRRKRPKASLMCMTVFYNIARWLKCGHVFNNIARCLKVWPCRNIARCLKCGHVCTMCQVSEVWPCLYNIAR